MKYSLVSKYFNEHSNIESNIEKYLRNLGLLDPQILWLVKEKFVLDKVSEKYACKNVLGASI